MCSQLRGQGAAASAFGRSLGILREGSAGDCVLPPVHSSLVSLCRADRSRLRCDQFGLGRGHGRTATCTRGVGPGLTHPEVNGRRSTPVPPAVTHQTQQSSSRGQASRLRRSAALALLPLAVACGGGEGDDAADRKRASAARTAVTAAPEAGVVAPAKVEVIAGLTGCTAEIRVDADELREGVCRTKQGEYRITTFPEERFKVTWLDTAAIYGGKYLVGTRWVVSARPELLEGFRSRLGGAVEELRGVGPTTSP